MAVPSGWELIFMVHFFLQKVKIKRMLDVYIIPVVLACGVWIFVEYIICFKTKKWQSLFIIMELLLTCFENNLRANLASCF